MDVSVIIPVYNIEKCKKKFQIAIQSVFSQTYTEWELIMVNDGSTDSTSSILQKYQNQNSKIRVFNKSNGG